MINNHIDNKELEPEMTNENTPIKKKPDEMPGIYVRGHIKIFDPENGEVFVDKTNAIHYENISEAIAQTLSNKGTNFIAEMVFGNGGTNVDPTGVINYLPSNTSTQNADLYSPVFFKNVDDTSTLNVDPARNKMTINHTPGQLYSDIVVSCLLDYGEPNVNSPGNLLGVNQSAFDSSVYNNGGFVFDELGLKGFSAAGQGMGKLLTHVVFHPVQKSLNRLIQIDYTVRIQTLTNLSAIG